MLIGIVYYLNVELKGCCGVAMNEHTHNEHAFICKIEFFKGVFM